MTENDNKPRRKRTYRRAIGAIVVLCLVIAGILYLRSARFDNFVRARITAQIEDATGGQVEVGRLQWSLSKLEIEARDLTVHGLESADEVPYIHADRIFARGKVGSLFHRALGFRYLEVNRPVVHIIVYPDGTTNQPRPKLKQASDGSPIQTLFEFSINKAEVKEGKLLINDRPIPLDFAASELAGTMSWFRSANRYDCQVHAGKLDATFEGMRPFSAVVDTQFSFWPTAAELKSLTLTSGQSRLEASGRLDDFLHPHVTVNYRTMLDLANVGSIARLPKLRDGFLSMEGRGVYSPAMGFVSTGNATVRKLEWREPFVRVRGVSASADFAVNQNRFKIDHMQARLAGGTASGELAVENWQGQTGVQQHGTARFQLAGINVSDLAAAFASRSLPFDQMKLVGRGNGDVALTWTGAFSDSVATIDAVLKPPAAPVNGELPVSAKLHGAYHAKAGVLDVASLTLTTPATHIVAAGTLGKATANIRTTATSSDLSEFAPLLAAAYGVQEMPIDLRGHASFDGTVRGMVAMPNITGRVQITDFNSDANLLQSSTGTGTVPRRMHWDMLSAMVQYSPALASVQNGHLQNDAAQLSFNGTAQLTKGKFTRTSPFAAQLAIHDAAISDLQAMAGYDYPISGAIDANIQISGTQDNPRASGRALVRNAIVYEQPINQIKSEIAFVDNDARFKNITVVLGNGRINGSGSYNLASHSYRFNLVGTNLRIEDIRKVQRQRLHATGALNFSADGYGTPQLPVINADVALSNVALDRERVGDITVRGRSVGEILKVSAQSKSEKGSAALEGTLRLRDDFQSSGAVRFTHVDLDPLLRVYTKGKLTGDSSFGGTINVHGPLRDWRRLEFEGELSELFVPIENVAIRNQGPVRFAVVDQTLNLQQLHLVAEDTDLSASGTVQFTGDQIIDLRAQGQANLKIIQSLNPDFTSYGLATLNLRIGGDLSNPRTVGRIQIANAGISYIDLPNGLSDVNGSLVFNRDRLQVQDLSARTGGGTVSVTGYVMYARGVSFNLQAVGEDIRLRYPQGVSSNANATLKLSGTPSAALLSGDIVIRKFGITPQFDLANYIARSRQPAPIPKPNSLLYNVKMDVHVTSTPELQVETALARLSGDVDLRLRGLLARPAVLGRVNIIEGYVSFNGTKYHVERGDISFSNPTGITPVFDIAANTRVRDYDITLGFHGSTERLTTTYRSDPPLSTADIIALLAFGRTREETALQSTPNQNLTEEASNAILGQAVNATVSSRMQKLFGVSRIKIDPEVGGAENNPSSARVTIEQQVAKNLTVTYITDIARSNQQVISMEYNVTRAVSIVAVRDQYGIVSFDVRIRQRKK